MRHILLMFCLLPALAAAQRVETEAVEAPEALPEATPAEDRPAPDQRALAVEDGRVSVEEIRRFVSVFRAVKQAYVEPVDDATLMRAAIRGLLADLDPHSTYLDAAQTRSLDEAAEGAYNGLGLEVFQNPDRSLTVIAPIDDTPAARAGIRPGDTIIKIDGEVIRADNVDAAVDSMRGEPGTEIRLTVMRDQVAEPIEMTLTRETIRIASVRSRRIDDGLAYVRVAIFHNDTAEEMRRQLEAMAGKRRIDGMVLDLRSNPGGLLTSAVASADLFLDSGLIVSTRGRLGHATSEYRARRGDVLDGAPIVVLIDAGTASAAEVVAGALRDHRRALIMGQDSFGKGSVQTVLPIDNGDALKLTTSRYYMPKGGSIQASGIRPDVSLPVGARLSGGARDRALRERDLPGHLAGEQSSAPAAESAAEEDDYALQEAVNLLKGLVVFRAQPGAGRRGAGP
ncbi:S41 family peptidase [Pseudomarimonas salicorniae]|uniref:S41 family peptidase n=1 Tax=Pseudomarimonas salicorniae TaxID=2933270 RepID=A0ABT0GE21_9GAMM|nr:S41 family peptidase [Lysobacter sp. CAU 1642]MCK7592245.1 S41 family peptidase [Lysobacter sp. CAU 1642]